MPAKKKSKQPVRRSQRTSENGSSSSEEIQVERKRTRSATSKLTQKLGQKEKANKSQSENDSEYYGDSECSTTTSQSEDSTKSCDMYDFNEPDTETSSLVLSTSHRAKKSRSKLTKSKKADIKKEIPKQKSTKPVSVRSFYGSDTNSEMEITETPASNKSDSTRRKCCVKLNRLQIPSPSVSIILPHESPIQTSQIENIISNQSTEKNHKRKASVPFDMTDSGVFSRSENTPDSGVFISPPPIKQSKLQLKDTSTPSPLLQMKDPIEDCFGFESIPTMEPMLSPVRTRVPSATSDYSSLMTSGSLYSESPPRKTQKKTIPVPSDPFMVSSGISGLVLDDEKPKKITKRKKKQSLSKYTEWAEQMNAQFEDLENYELSIEG